MEAGSRDMRGIQRCCPSLYGDLEICVAKAQLEWKLPRNLWDDKKI